MSHVLIFANGDIQDGPMVRQIIESGINHTVIAADGGARLAYHFNLSVDLIIGDMDSVSPEMLTKLAAGGTQVRRFSPEKDFNDLELALICAIEEFDAQTIRIVGGLGDRIDQTLANIYLLSLPLISGRDVRLVAGNQALWLLTAGEHHIEGMIGDTISLIPLGGAVHGIHTKQLYYPLEDETLYFGPTRGISNVMQGESASIIVGDGTLLLIHTIGRA